MKNFEVPTTRPTARQYEPQRWPTPKADVATPLLQAVVTAVLISVTITAIVWQITGVNPTPVLATTFCLTLTLTWFWRLGVVTETLWHVEEAIGHDLTGDHVVGKPTPAPRPSVRIEVARDNHAEYVDLELEDLPELRKFALLGITGRFNERAVKQQFNWSRERWQEVRDDLIARGWVEWNGNDGRQGVNLTALGEKALREVLAHTT